mmetsp:Transcript_32269/g.64321  ORF Transcript_32269/g.64321 Transcript_32269/m.64321 type:complete len:239 (-) Transcript_32269:434-1150(-)
MCCRGHLSYRRHLHYPRGSHRRRSRLRRRSSRCRSRSAQRAAKVRRSLLRSWPQTRAAHHRIVHMKETSRHHHSRRRLLRRRCCCCRSTSPRRRLFVCCRCQRVGTGGGGALETKGQKRVRVVASVGDDRAAAGFGSRYGCRRRRRGVLVEAMGEAVAIPCGVSGGASASFGRSTWPPLFGTSDPLPTSACRSLVRRLGAPSLCCCCWVRRRLPPPSPPHQTRRGSPPLRSTPWQASR